MSCAHQLNVAHVNQSIPFRIEFAPEVPSKVRSRISYAFRVFAAIYGHEVTERNEGGRSLRLIYGKGGRQKQDDSEHLYVPWRYVFRQPQEAAPSPHRCLYAGEHCYLFYGRDETSGKPDWLGEIFEWLSSAHEMSVAAARDHIGRIPYDQTIFGRDSVSPLRPYASFLMSWLENAIINPGGPERIIPAPSPLPGSDHLVVCSHDIDFYFVGRWKALIRLAKNVGISAFVYRRFSFFKDNLRLVLKLARGARVGDFLPELLAASRERGFSSTFFVLVKHQHRRDANYSLKEMLPRLREIAEAGSAIGLHGSYQSVIENRDWKSEADTLEASLGHRPLGVRQHWLRFDRHEKLFANIEEAGLLYDSSLGFRDRVGFRNGAAFAFPPYNFELEEPYGFLHIPLVIMDSALVFNTMSSPGQAATLAATVLQESKRLGWGGCAVLWHNPVEPIGVPSDINEVFWELVKDGTRRGDSWISAEEFLRLSRVRYEKAGLLKPQHLSEGKLQSRVEAVVDPVVRVQ